MVMDGEIELTRCTGSIS